MLYFVVYKQMLRGETGGNGPLARHHVGTEQKLEREGARKGTMGRGSAQEESSGLINAASHATTKVHS